MVQVLLARVSVLEVLRRVSLLHVKFEDISNVSESAHGTFMYVKILSTSVVSVKLPTFNIR
jgi:hypothetical protein